MVPLAPDVARAAASDLVDDDEAEVVVRTLGEGKTGADCMEVINNVTGPTDVLPALLTANDVRATDETMTTDDAGWLDRGTWELMISEETMTVDGASDVITTEAKVSVTADEGLAAETTDGTPEVNTLVEIGLEAKTPSKN